MVDARETKSYLHANTPSLGRRKQPRVVPFKLSEVDLGRDKRNVYLRIKPKRNSKKEETPYAVVDENTLTAVLRKDGLSAKVRADIRHQYKFTKIFGAGTTQDTIFHEVCESPVTDFLRGGNCLLFAYGATNAGKTYTIRGIAEKPGIIPRTINRVFNSIKNNVSKDIKYKPDKANNVLWLDDEEIQKEYDIKNSIVHSSVDRSFAKSYINYSKSTVFSEDSLNVGSSVLSDSSVVCPIFQDMKKNLNESVVELNEEANTTYSVWVSYAEIYNENIFDLLQPPTRFQRKPLMLGENDQKDVYIRGLTEVCVSSGDEAFKVFLYGQHNLHTAPTSINHVSSRSHSIFSMRLIKYLKTDCPTFACLSTCTFVDLAGAERAKKTHNIGERMKESQSINTSLHVLGKCLEVLRQNQKSKDTTIRMLPCRESKLTRLFQRALEGKDVFTMIVNINQDECLFDETINVLKFSAVAMELEFTKSGKQNMCPLRSSRLSDYMMKNSMSFSVTSLETLQESLMENTRCVDCMRLLADNEKLHKAMEEEKRQIEMKVRKELGEHFWTTVTQLDNAYREQLQVAKEAQADRDVMTLDIYRQYCERQNKRRKDSEESDEESDDDEERTIEYYEDEIQSLKRKIDGMKHLLETANGEKAANAQLQMKYNKLQFEMATVKQELQEEKKIADVITIGKNADPSAKVFENQLDELRSLIKSKDDELKETKKLLNEACDLYNAHVKEHEDAACRNQEMERSLASKEETIEDLQTKLNLCHKKLAEHSNMVTAKEQEENEIHMKYQAVCEARDEFKFMVTQMEGKLKKLEKENSQLKLRVSDRRLSSPSEVRALEALVASHEDQLKRNKEKIKVLDELNKELQEEIATLKSNSVVSNQDQYDKEIALLQKEIKDAIQEKKEMQKKVDIAMSEHSACRENLKMTEAALTQEEKNTKEMKKIVDAEKEILSKEIEQIQVKMTEYENERDGLIQELQTVKLQNLELEDIAKRREDALDLFKARRDEQFKSYEDMLKKEKEGRQREQREVQKMQNIMRTTTPQKSEDLAEIKKLKEELKDAHMKIAELQKASKTKSSVKGRSRTKKVQDENCPQLEKDLSVMELPNHPVVVKPDPDARQLRPRHRKKLYASEEVETPLECNKVRTRRQPI